MQSINRAQRRRSSGEARKRAPWAALEGFARHQIQDWAQDLLEKETSSFWDGESRSGVCGSTPAGVTATATGIRRACR